MRMSRTYTHIHTHIRERARVQRASPLCESPFSRVPFNSVASSLLVPCSCPPLPLLFLRPFSSFFSSSSSSSSSSSTSYGSDSGFQHGVLVAANSMRDDGRDSRRTVTADRRSIMDRDRETLIVLSNAIDSQRNNTCPYTRTSIYFSYSIARARTFSIYHIALPSHSSLHRSAPSSRTAHLMTVPLATSPPSRHHRNVVPVLVLVLLVVDVVVVVADDRGYREPAPPRITPPPRANNKGEDVSLGDDTSDTSSEYYRVTGARPPARLPSSSE